LSFSIDPAVDGLCIINRTFGFLSFQIRRSLKRYF
jgi:hypothetical protein